VLTEPLGYIQFMNLVRSARAVITDSGGVQEESTYLGIPCLTLRENTERPITLTEGSNRLVQPSQLHEQVREVLAGRWPAGRRPALWDGRAAQRCVDALKRRARVP
jgi:UDP-N-acetylglucosamine 2-epimerase (non-hydrolysing)